MLTWIASYPKSGNTWIRLALHALRSGEDFDMNSVGKSVPSLTTVISDYLKHQGISITQPHEIQTYIPVIEQMAVDQKVRFMKTHMVAATYEKGLFPNPKLLDKVIYIVRDPRDLAVSFASHTGMTLEQAVTSICSQENVITVPNNPARSELLADWGTHIRCWMQVDEQKRFVARYEDLLADPKRCFTALFQFLSLPHDDETVERVLRLTSFENLSEAESSGRFVEAPPERKFFRQGQAEIYKEQDQAVFAPIVEKYGALMTKLGYLPQA